MLFSEPLPPSQSTWFMDGPYSNFEITITYREEFTQAFIDSYGKDLRFKMGNFDEFLIL